MGRDFPGSARLRAGRSALLHRVQRAQLAGRCEARAYARMGERERTHAFDALRRADRGMPSQPATDDPDAAWSLFSPGALELYTRISLLWLGDAKRAEPHARQAIACYEIQPPLLQSSANQAQARITLATCLVGHDQPDEGIRLATEALVVDRGQVEPNLRQARAFLAALPPRHRDLPAARDLAERLRSPAPPAQRPTPGSPHRPRDATSAPATAVLLRVCPRRGGGVRRARRAARR